MNNIGLFSYFLPNHIKNIFIFLLRFITALCYTTSTSNFGHDIFIMFQCPQKSLAKISFLNFICFFSKEFTQIFDEVTRSTAAFSDSRH